MWFGHWEIFCQTYWSSAILGVVTTSYGLFRMNPSTGLCVKYDWYDSVKGLLCWYSAVLTDRLSFNRETANNRCTFDEVKLLRLRVATNFDNILNLFDNKYSSQNRSYINTWEKQIVIVHLSSPLGWSWIWFFFSRKFFNWWISLMTLIQIEVF